jgi:hypothetical protein
MPRFFLNFVTVKDRFGFAAQKRAGMVRWPGRKLKRSCGELNRSLRSVMGIECRRFRDSDSERDGEGEAVTSEAWK